MASRLGRRVVTALWPTVIEERRIRSGSGYTRSASGLAAGLK